MNYLTFFKDEKKKTCNIVRFVIFFQALFKPPL